MLVVWEPKTGRICVVGVRQASTCHLISPPSDFLSPETTGRKHEEQSSCPLVFKVKCSHHWSTGYFRVLAGIAQQEATTGSLQTQWPPPALLVLLWRMAQGIDGAGESLRLKDAQDMGSTPLNGRILMNICQSFTKGTLTSLILLRKMKTNIYKFALCQASFSYITHWNRILRTIDPFYRLEKWGMEKSYKTRSTKL